MSDDLRICALVPTYDNPMTVQRVVEQVCEHVPVVIVVDDGSHEPARQVLDRLANVSGVVLLRHEHNRGKGAAVKTGLREAAARGFTHALQVDADGQHELRDIPRFLDCARKQPRALVLASPSFDETRPAGRDFGHWLTSFWTRIEVGSSAIADPQCGFRVYPVADTQAVTVRGNRMDFDIEIAVRLCWHGTPVVNLPTRVRYLQASEGGVSHFHMGADNLLISWMHTRLTVLAIVRWLLRPFRSKGRGGG
ncbi:glycosyltransferase family 2 protein [Paraliomyxa miuraensis]|uniref:glycosyltransferase family 2 protein n=1 Tax=Paraliomyxa miuraensis TaxID=376150 RepID=UPI002251987B|nr:glycosyltransferase family 2 protein [Paraliomyxa miuraensis]MCX4247046.1 glycosyltransferase family 2 protein [Paraliomyxa miuraensis]